MNQQESRIVSEPIGSEEDRVDSLSNILQRRYLLTFKEPMNRFQGIDSVSQCSMAGRYGKLIPTRILAPINCYKISHTSCYFSHMFSPLPRGKCQ
jgi:hypothetical protein